MINLNVMNMMSYNREVRKLGVCDDGSVKGSRGGREKRGVDRYIQE